MDPRPKLQQRKSYIHEKKRSESTKILTKLVQQVTKLGGKWNIWYAASKYMRHWPRQTFRWQLAASESREGHSWESVDLESGGKPNGLRFIFSCEALDLDSGPSAPTSRCSRENYRSIKNPNTGSSRTWFRSRGTSDARMFKSAQNASQRLEEH